MFCCQPQTLNFSIILFNQIKCFLIEILVPCHTKRTTEPVNTKLLSGEPIQGFSEAAQVSNYTGCFINVDFDLRMCQCCTRSVVHPFVMKSISAGAQAEGRLSGPSRSTNPINCPFIHQGEYFIHFYARPSFSLPLFHYLFVYLNTYFLSNQKI